MDPATIVSTVAASIELAGFAYKVISVGNELIIDNRNNIPLNESRTDSTRGLKELNDKFVERYHNIPQGELSEDDLKKIEMCKACNRIAEEILSILEGLEVNEDRHKNRKKILAAFKTVWKETGIEERRSRLDMYRNQLELTFIVDMSLDQKANAVQQSQYSNEMMCLLHTIKDEQEKQNNRGSYKMDLVLENINKLGVQLQDATLRVPTPGPYRPGSPGMYSENDFTMIEPPSYEKAAGGPSNEKPTVSIHEIVNDGDRSALRKRLNDPRFPTPVYDRDERERTALHLAAERGDLKMIAMLLAHNAPANAPDEISATPLHYAVKSGSVPVVRKLLEAGANRNAEDDADNTAIDLAKDQPEMLWILANGPGLEDCDTCRETALIHFTRRQNHEAVASLLNQGANVNARGREENTALMEAAWQNNFELVSLIMQYSPNVNDANSPGNTALMAYCQNDDDTDFRIFEMLVEAGTDVRKQNRWKYNAAVECARHNNPKELRILLSMNCPVDHQTTEGHTALTLAAKKRGHDAVVSVLCESGKVDINGVNAFGKTALAEACLFKNPAVVRVLLKHNADANSIDKVSKNYTPMHEAIKQQHVEIVRELLKVPGIQLNHANVDGWRPLHEAVGRSNFEITKMLLDAGADQRLSDNRQVNPFQRAVMSNAKPKLIELLLDRGADIEDSDDVGNTGLLHAILRGHFEAFECLLRRGANVKVKNGKGYTALCAASMYNRTRMVKLLLENGSTPQEANKDGWTPLAEAALYGHIEIARMLLEKGANPLALDNNAEKRKTPLFRAAEKEQWATLKLMCEYLKVE